MLILPPSATVLAIGHCYLYQWLHNALITQVASIKKLPMHDHIVASGHARRTIVRILPHPPQSHTHWCGVCGIVDRQLEANAMGIDSCVCQVEFTAWRNQY